MGIWNKRKVQFSQSSLKNLTLLSCWCSISSRSLSTSHQSHPRKRKALSMYNNTIYNNTIFISYIFRLTWIYYEYLYMLYSYELEENHITIGYCSQVCKYDIFWLPQKVLDWQFQHFHGKHVNWSSSQQLIQKR